MSSAISDVSKNGVLLFYHMLPNVPICPPSPESKNRETNDLDEDIVLKPSPTTEHDEAARNDDKSTRKTCDDIYEHFDVDENLDLEHDNPLSNTTEDSDADKGIPNSDQSSDDIVIPQTTMSKLSSSSTYSKYFEADIARYSTFRVDETEWLKLRKEQRGTTFPLQWVNIFYNGLQQSNRFCTLMFRRHRVSKKNSRKQPQHLFKAEAYCSRKPDCPVSATLYVDCDLVCHVHYTGRIKHRTTETSQRPIRAEDREVLRDELWKEHCPSRMHTEKLRQMEPDVFDSGNITGVGVDGNVFRQIGYEGRRRLQSDRDITTSLQLKQQTTLSGYIRQITVSPSYVIAFTEAGVRLFHDLAAAVPIHWDATGSVAWKEGSKEYLYYAIVVPNAVRQRLGFQSSPCPIAELVTTSQTEPTISNWLEIFKYHEKRIYGYNRTTTPCLISSDRSLPLLIASLKVFSGETFRQFLQRSWRIVNGNASSSELNGMIIHTGLSHFMKDAKQFCKKYYRKSQAWFGLSLFRLLSAVHKIEEFRRLLYSICIVLRSEHFTEICHDHVNNLLDKIHKQVPDQMKEGCHEDNEGGVNDIDTGISTKRYTCTEQDAFLQESSPFKNLSSSVDEDAKQEIANCIRHDDGHDIEPNEYRSVELLEKIMRYILPTLPVWSNLLLGDLSRHSERYQQMSYDSTRFFIQHPPTTQGYIEAYNKIFKHCTLANYRFRLDELVQKMYDFALVQQRKFALQWKVRSSKRAGKKATTLISETWKRTPANVKERMKENSSHATLKRKLSTKIKPKNYDVKHKPEHGGTKRPRGKSTKIHTKANQQCHATHSTDVNTPHKAMKDVHHRQGNTKATQETQMTDTPLTNRSGNFVQSRRLHNPNKNRKPQKARYCDQNEDTNVKNNGHGFDQYEKLLHNTEWLDDIIINDFMHLIQQQTIDSHTFVCNSFHTKSSNTEERQARKWYGGQKIIASKWVLMPVNDGNCHWILLAANLVQKKIYLLDPLCDRKVNEDLNIFRRFIEARSAFEGKPIICKQWPVKTTSDMKFPFQPTMNDCGLYILFYAKSLLSGKNVPVTDIRTMRLSVYYKLHEFDMTRP
ncbi:uncharacterized protein [Apostichopus japonicus]|uniref:uncharacterized protein n=1 Tax=Stichopus japonicus TaxID=307972 RepID=UPI003AB5CC5E